MPPSEHRVSYVRDFDRIYATLFGNLLFSNYKTLEIGKVNLFRILTFTFFLTIFII